MKLHEEFRLYESLWESIETSAIVFVGNERNKDALLSKVAKMNPAHTTIVFDIADFLRNYDAASRETVCTVKFYTDADGMAELEKACAIMPERLSKPILSAVTLVEATCTTKLTEAVDFISQLKAKETTSPWYTEYFAVGPAVCDLATNEVLTPEDFADYWEDFEAAMNDVKNYTVMPVVFGPSGDRTYTKEAFDTLEEALDNVLEFSYADDVRSYDDLTYYMMNATITDNSATFLTATAPDNQDIYGCFVRVSQKPLNSNRQLGKYFLARRGKSGSNMLACMLDDGLVADPISVYPNYELNRCAWQAK
jgi:hypothetical protein